MMLFSLLSFPAHARTDASDNSAERVRFARMDGFWSIRRSDTLFSIAESFFPTEKQGQDNFIRDLMKLNRLNAAPADPLPSGRRLELPAYIMQPVMQAPPASGDSGGNPFRMPRNGRPLTIPAPPSYRDQLINSNVEEADGTEEQIGGEPLGRKSIAVRVDTQFQRLNPGAFSVDKGVSVSGQFETLDYGDIRIDATSRLDDHHAGGASSANLVTVSHGGLALSDSVRADSILGVVRAPGNNFVGSGARFGLPPLIFEGVAATLSGQGQQVHFSHGRLGRIEGNTAQTFRQSNGGLVSLGLNQGFGINWKAGAQWLVVHGLGHNENGSSAAAAVEFAQPPDTGDGMARIKLQALSGAAGGRGIWGDGEWIYGRITHRFGAYRFDPGLRWGNIDVANDVQGGYWRADARQGSNAYTLGMDMSETNLKRDPLRAGTLTRTLFGSASRRMSRMLTIGSALELKHDDSLTSLAHSSNAFKLSSFGAVSSDWGVSRFDVYTGRKQDSLPSRDRIIGAGWSHDWYRFSGMATNSSISVTQQTEQGRLARMATAGIIVRKGISERIIGDAGLILSRNIGPYGGSSEASVTTNLLFQITADWNLSAALMMRRPVSGEDRGTCDIRASVSLSYEKSSGIPYSRVYGSRSGTGSIHGVVFYDENNDGVQQATEKAATNVTVYLDGRLAATTDAGGRFVFPVLPAGEHALSLRPEALPLPWTAEPASLQVRVPLRGAASISLPLTRLPG